MPKPMHKSHLVTTKLAMLSPGPDPCFFNFHVGLDSHLEIILLNLQGPSIDYVNDMNGITVERQDQYFGTHEI